MNMPHSPYDGRRRDCASRNNFSGRIQGVAPCDLRRYLSNTSKTSAGAETTAAATTTESATHAAIETAAPATPYGTAPEAT